MRKRIGKLVALGAALVALIGLNSPGLARANDPLFVLTPIPPASPFEPLEPPPTGYLEGPCGLAVHSSGNFYVSDYYHHTIDVFSSSPKYSTQLTNVDPLDGPCGLALDSNNNLYVNNYHRNVAKFTSSFLGGPVFDAARHPTGVAVDIATNNFYVNDRTYIAAYAPSGAPLLDEGNPLQVGLGSLEEGFGLAVSAYPGTAGRLYVPDATTDTVKVYDPAIDKDDPVATIDGSAVPGGGFVSMRDAAVAVDRVTGNVYVVDNLQPKYTEKPQAAIYIFGPTGTYLGHLKYNIVDALPAGLAVDNTTGGTQGRVYVTSGNTERASIYAYPPGSQTNAAPLPPLMKLEVETGGAGSGSVASDRAGIDCSTACATQIHSGAEVALTATPNPGSTFAGWSGPDCSGTGSCTVEMSKAREVKAQFNSLKGPSTPTTSSRPGGGAQASEIAQKGALRLSVEGRLSPRRLPREGAAPIAVSVGWSVATTDGSAVPKLKGLRIEINRHGRFDHTGLPTCPYHRIQPASSSRALANCRAALVGRGSFDADIALRGQEPYATRGRLLVFNGKSHGKPVLFGQIYSPYPFPTSFVIVFAVQKIGKGTFGTALSATLPPSLASWGNLTGIEMKLSRRYAYQGKRRSYISAGCPAPKGFGLASFRLARTAFTFVGGEQLSSSVVGNCRVR